MYKLFHCRPIFLPASAGSGSVLVRQFPHLAAKLAEAAHRAVQPMPEAIPEPVHDRLTASSLGYCCRVVQQLATEACCQPPAQRAAVPLVAQDVISAPASQAFVGDFYSLWSAD